VKGKWTVSLFGQLVLLLKGWVLDVSKHRILLPPFGKKWHGSRLSVELASATFKTTVQLFYKN